MITIKLPEHIKWDIVILDLQVSKWKNGWVVRYRNYGNIAGELCFIEPFRCYSKSKERAILHMYKKLKAKNLVS